MSERKLSSKASRYGWESHHSGYHAQKAICLYPSKVLCPSLCSHPLAALKQGGFSVSLENMTPIKANEFGIEQFKRSGVWTWQSDLHASEDSLVPVPLNEEALAEADSLLIHTKFVTASDTELVGLVVYQLGDDEVFAIEVLTEGQRFTFNKHVPDLSMEELQRLAIVLDQNVDDLRPFRYSIQVKELAIEDGEFTF
jgi:hypothetical protein